jgi:GLPGLI family protein
MKIVLKKSLFFVLSVLMFSSFVGGNEFFTGKIIYDIKYENLPAEAKAYASMMPNKSIYYFNNAKSRVETEPKGMLSNVIITDYENKKMRILMEVMGNKMQIVNDSEIGNEEKETPEFQTTTETKKIAGYECKKVLMKTEDATISLWVSDKINAYNKNGQYKGLEGFPLEFTVSQQGMSIIYTASKVEPGKVESKLFDIPKDYKEVTQEELMNMFGGR